MLRQDPDIIMVGEIRDLETARIAFQAAMTGHLVLSTLHTNDTASTIARLVDLGIEPYLVATTVNAVLAQRLARILCEECKEPYEPTDVELNMVKNVHPGPYQFFKPVGCPRCNATGYYGRTAIMELLVLTPNIKDIILNGGSAREIMTAARTAGMRSLREAGLAKVAQGLTSFDEVFSATFSEMDTVGKCQVCKNPVEPEFEYCPYCGNQLSALIACSKCARPLRPSWTVCPYCGTAAEAAVTARAE